jgi:hypothetical protein
LAQGKEGGAPVQGAGLLFGNGFPINFSVPNIVLKKKTRLLPSSLKLKLSQYKSIRTTRMEVVAISYELTEIVKNYLVKHPCQDPVRT